MKTLNTQTSLSEIRRLLDLWYKAQATPAQEKELIEWFVATPDENIPADMGPDAQIFRELAVERIATVKSSEFENALLKASSNASQRVIKYYAIAACIVTLIVLSVGLYFVQSKDTEAESSILLAENRTVIKNSVDSIMGVAALHENEPTEQLGAIQCDEHMIISNKLVCVDTISAEQAAVLLENVINTVDENLEYARRALIITDESVDKSQNLINESVNELINTTSIIIS